MTTTTEGMRTVVVLLFMIDGDGWATYEELAAYQGRDIIVNFDGRDHSLSVGTFSLRDCFEVVQAGLAQNLRRSFRLNLDGWETVKSQLDKLARQDTAC